MKSTQIGIVTMSYDDKGHVTTNSFKSLIKEKSPISVIKQLKKIECNNDPETIMSNAQMVMSGWFTRVSKVELGDRDKFKINAEIKSCEKWPNGMVKECSILFTFDELEETVPSA